MRSNVHSVIIYTVIIYSVCSLGRSAAKGISGCIVPSEPDHGSYITPIQKESPDDVQASVRLEYFCDDGYELAGPYSVSCNDGVWSETPHVPECIPHCSIDDGTSIVTYGADETRCSIPQTFTKQTSGLSQRMDGKIDSRRRPAAEEISGCIVHSEPDHGSYITPIQKESPDDVQAPVRLEYFCDDGYELVGPHSVSCNDGVWSETPHVPECIPHCRIENGTSIVTLRPGETRCSIPGSYNNELIPNRLSVETCGARISKENFVAGGEPATIEEMPWHAGVYKKTTRPYKQICGGTLISHRIVVSAAHCFWSDVKKLLPASNYAVAVGKRYRPWDDKNDEAQRSDISEIEVPPRFHAAMTNFQDDLALLILASPVEFNFYVNPVCLDFDHELEDAQLQPGNLGMFCGWGLTEEDGEASQVLMSVEMPYVPVEQCIAEAPREFLTSITSDKICAGNEDGIAVCQGDSGGGLVFPAEDRLGFDRYYLRGVASTAPTSEHKCNVHARATFTLISKHERFITDIIEEY